MTPLQKKYLRYKTLVDRRLSSLISRKDPLSLYGPAQYVLDAGGKRIRPLLVMLACEAVGGTAKQALNAAVAIEVLHNFTLVHDDIMDNADARRGRPTVHKKWDSNVAILTGDALVAEAYRVLLKTKTQAIAHVADLFTEGVIEVCEGQAYDKVFESRRDVTLDEYMLMIAKKTGKLVAISSEIGAVIGGGTARDVRILRQYGELIGRAFQIQDDLLDVVADEKTFGKKIGGDIVEGKKTFLLLNALEHSRGRDKGVLQSVIAKSGTDCANIQLVREIYERTGALEIAKKAIERDIQKATGLLAGLSDTPARAMLYWLSDMLLNRHF
ncbi:MAG TPA: polyprenyl synthetase family protein [Bacteroidota bacterium]|nr:polyprenyl synthetase family protein [Bacteroidota bacterium]